jgi:broad specificity phosphatase PhoE
MRLSKIKFKQIIVSDLKRTKKTAEEIIKSLENKENLELVYTKLAREKNGGIFEGKDLSIKKLFQKVSILC